MFKIDELDGFVESFTQNGKMVIRFTEPGLAEDSIKELEYNGYFCRVSDKDSCLVIID